MNREILERCGIDYASGLERFMGDVQLYESVLEMFLEDESYAKITNARQNNDHDGLVSALHELKGVSGNLSIAELFSVTKDAHERTKNGESAEAVMDLLDRIDVCYAQTIEGIKMAGGGSE